ncbi:MAG TPA: hypothetical protein VFB44_06560 [Thermoleophilaceae bacterium]|nr:hypothetical protein [Thermoleophilaceae bacterium]
MYATAAARRTSSGSGLVTPVDTGVLRPLIKSLPFAETLRSTLAEERSA